MRRQLLIVMGLVVGLGAAAYGQSMGQRCEAMGTSTHGPQDQAAAFQHYQRAAELGNVEAQALLGAIYERGWAGVPRDINRAVARTNTMHVDAAAATTATPGPGPQVGSSRPAVTASPSAERPQGRGTWFAARLSAMFPSSTTLPRAPAVSRAGAATQMTAATLDMSAMAKLMTNVDSKSLTGPPVGVG